MELFSYARPNCATFEPLLHTLRAALPAGVALKRSSVDFLGREMGPELQRAFAVAELLSAESIITPAMFNQMCTVRKSLQERRDVKAVFTASGVSAEAFVINGKYMVKLGAVKEPEQLNKLVLF